jgi:hypothetical protein
VTDAETTILYALSTLAQTCAALAAFVGAVGLYRLQSLRDRRRDLLRDIEGNLGHLPTTEEVLLDEARRQAPDRRLLTPLLQEAEQMPHRLRQSRRSLVAFEGWNLLVIFAALVGFNHVTALAACRWTLWALWPVALGTVAVTGYCVFVWTRE